MRYAIIGDIHGNLEAFSAVLSSIDQEKIDHVLCVGDIIGYGANPVECINLVKEKCFKVVAGNHDYAAIGLTDIDYFNPFAKDAVLWTSEKLGEKEINYIASLKLIDREDSFTIVHSTLDNPREWGYILNTFDAAAHFELQTDPLCFVGHSHGAVAYVKRENFISGHRFVNKIDAGCKYIVNVGSVGQSRDGDYRASYVIYDHELQTLKLKRVEYDVKITQKKIMDAGLPQILADRLSIGR
jgi:predicted phosphodiesterase